MHYFWPQNREIWYSRKFPLIRYFTWICRFLNDAHWIKKLEISLDCGKWLITKLIDTDILQMNLKILSVLKNLQIWCLDRLFYNYSVLKFLLCQVVNHLKISISFRYHPLGVGVTMWWMPSPSVNSTLKNKVPRRGMPPGGCFSGRKSSHRGTIQARIKMPQTWSTSRWWGASSSGSTGVTRWGQTIIIIDVTVSGLNIRVSYKMQDTYLMRGFLIAY